MTDTPADGGYGVTRGDGLLRITFDRPEQGNALPPGAVPQLTALLRAAQSDRSVRCLLFEGAGKVFSAGGDVAGFAKSLEIDPAARQQDFARRLGNLSALVEALAAFERPIVVGVRGAAAGAGLLYPLIADYVVGDPSASFVFAHQRVGLSPDGGVSYLLPRVVGERAARTLLLTAAKIDAQEALRLGILSRLVAADVFEADVMSAARRLAAAPQQAVAAAKRLVNEASQNSLARQLEAERAQIVQCVAHPDFEEGVRAFLEKRRPDFPSTRA
jgi:2-(1,2-epoxy-1,2-dihydrophenyl)acetyl-CoA isomerase